MSDFAEWLGGTSKYDWSQHKRDLAKLAAQQHEALERLRPMVAGISHQHELEYKYKTSAIRSNEVVASALQAAKDFQDRYEVRA